MMEASMDFSPWYYPNGRKRYRSRKRREIAQGATFPSGLLFKFDKMDDAEKFAAVIRSSIYYDKKDSRKYARARIYVNAAQEPYAAVDGFRWFSVKSIKEVASKMGGSLIGP
jgi:hypothetical protein